ncbi:DUF1330 domain-containing protein [Reichenbachiella carrageenanivorans]|uniref:DUF1330 domain-containing protein n=1 Tax=Reichenbachiella carrageenanivorans TaxID=2979869 RepID=A0ABY6D2C9_9BACT|nr:DUF1330 domain-containing protein [Reichenbachiella carrageenanivorans]UXX79228.1 DUF1330 domain-containing protein [Reichenbachiella carrageenanivorans]
MIFITQLIYIKPGKEAEFHAFENQAIPLMGKYTGRLVQRLRPTQETYVAGEEKKPYEIHIVSFESEEKLQAFFKDDTRLQFKHLKDGSVESILMFKGEKM